MAARETALEGRWPEKVHLLCARRPGERPPVPERCVADRERPESRGAGLLRRRRTPGRGGSSQNPGTRCFRARPKGLCGAARGSSRGDPRCAALSGPTQGPRVSRRSRGQRFRVQPWGTIRSDMFFRPGGAGAPVFSGGNFGPKLVYPRKTGAWPGPTCTRKVHVVPLSLVRLLVPQSTSCSPLSCPPGCAPVNVLFPSFLFQRRAQECSSNDP